MRKNRWAALLELHQQRSSATSDSWREQARTAIILAGGRGVRLAPMVRARLGRDLPKQFCSFDGGPTLLQATLARTEALVEPSHTFVSVGVGQHELALEQLPDSSARVVSQPGDRGTAVGLLLPLLEALIEDPRTLILFSPADHAFARVEPLLDTLEHAFEAVDARLVPMVLVGVGASRPASDYGWIVPSDAPGPAGLQRALGVVEKPAPAAARELHEAGALWSTMMGVASGRVLFHAFEAARPELVARLMFAMEQPPQERRTRLEAIYHEIDAVDLSSDVLPFVEGPAVAELPPEVGWTDLGTPERLEAWLADNGRRKVSGITLRRQGDQRHDDRDVADKAADG